MNSIINSALGKDMIEKNAYDFSFSSLTKSEPLPLSDFKGKVILVVNTASDCTFTSQFEGLERIYNKYKDKGLIIIGVPSNDFGKQEPGTNEQIAEFCQINYGVSFPMTQKEIVSGDKAHPFYIWAREKLGSIMASPRWNFHKYLVDHNGDLVDYFYSTTGPDSTRLIKSIESYLNKKNNE